MSLFAFLVVLSAGCGQSEREVTHSSILNNAYTVSEIGQDVTQLSSPYGIVCREEDVLVCDYSGNKIVILDPEGNYLGEVGTSGSAPLEFIRPTGITQTDQYIYVIDSGNDRIQILDQDLVFVREIGLPGTSPSEAVFFMDIAVTSDEEIYLSTNFVEKKTSRIYKVSEENTVVEVSSRPFWGYLASAGNEIYGVSSMEFYKEKNVQGARSGECSLKNITAGKDISELPYKYCPLDFVVYGDKYYCLSAMTASLDRLDSEGVYLDTIAQMPSLALYSWVDVSSDGKFYVTNRMEGSVYIVRIK